MLKLLLLCVTCLTAFASSLLGTTADGPKDVALLRKASAEGVASVKAVVAQGADLESKDQVGETALMKAAESGCAKCITVLVEAGANVNAKTKTGVTSLMWAVYMNHPEAVAALLAAHADANAVAQNALFESTNGFISPLQTGDDITALILATRLKDRFECLKALIAGGAVVNLVTKDGKTALIVGAADPKVAKALIAAGADVNAHDWTGYTALMHATFYCEPTSVKELLEAGADVNAKPSKVSNPAIVYAAELMDTQCLDLLIAAGANVNAKGLGGMTALFWGARHGNIKIIKALIAAHADVNVQEDNDGWTPLKYAEQAGCEDCVAALRAAGAR